MICNKCGCKIENDTKFCARCGADLRQEGATVHEVSHEVLHEPESKNIIMAFIFGLAGVIFTFVLSFDSQWYITLVSLLFKITGFVLSLIALIIVLKSPKPRKGLTLAAFILSIIGLVFCGIAMTVELNNLIRGLIDPPYYWY